MPYRVIVGPEISRAVGGFELNRDALLKVLNKLRYDLAEQAAKHRQLRDPVRPDLYFWYEIIVADQGRPRRFRFVVDDVQATDYLIVVEAAEIP